MAKKKRFELRLWVYQGEERIFGPGRMELLERIDDTGSVSKAARGMGMSYKKAWRMVDEMNQLASEPYVLLQKGGKQGGGAELTPKGRLVVSRYRKIVDRLNKLVTQQTDFLQSL
jgi:molybdate transport system regulatory protein